MINVGILYDHLEYFMVIWYNLWPFGIVCGDLLYFFPIWLDPEKSGNPVKVIGSRNKIFRFLSRPMHVNHFLSAKCTSLIKMTAHTRPRPKPKT
jgi:hypothetical protein